MALNNPGGFKSVQSGLIDTSTATLGTAPEVFYVDVTVSAVNTAKSMVLIDGCMGNDASTQNTADQVGRNAFFNAVQMVKGYMLNTTTLRIFAGNSGGFRRLTGRWQIVESW